MEEQDITIKYRAKAFVDLASLYKGSTLFIGELVRTPDGRVLIPKMDQQTANLFVIFAATDELTPVMEFEGFYAAEEFLLKARSEGWEVMRGRDILPGIGGWRISGPVAPTIVTLGLGTNFPNGSWKG